MLMRMFSLVMTSTLILMMASPLHAQKKAKSKALDRLGNEPSMWLVEPTQPLPENVKHLKFFSPSMKCDVGYCIYLPPGYESRTDVRFPVIYHLHGAGGNETRSVYSAEVIHRQILEGKVPEMIMVFPNGGRSTMYQDSGNGKFLAETMMIKELIPHIDATYRTISDRKGRCIEGFSMGGRGSTHLAMKYPEMFSSLFNQSGNVYRVSDASQLPNDYLGGDRLRLEANDPYRNVAKNLDYIRSSLRIRMGCGTADPTHLPSIRDFHSYLKEMAVQHEYFEVEGLDHTQRKMIDGMKETWFDFHVTSLKQNQVNLVYVK